MTKRAMVMLAAAGTGCGLVLFGYLGCQSGGFTPNATVAGFPYKPQGCDYAVNIPEVDQGGFDDGKLGAAPAPAHVHVSWAGPTSSTFAVNWKTDPDTTATAVLYGTDQAAVKAADGAAGAVKLATGHHMLFGSDPNQVRVHEAHVCGLDPSKTYYYKVGGKGGWSAVYDVGTGPAVGASESFQFAVTGDSRGAPEVWAKIEQALSQRGVDFQLFSGDAVTLGTDQKEWNEFFEAKTGGFAAQDFMARTQTMVVNGNHDALTVNYAAQFAVPQEQSSGEKAQGEEWYSFDYGNAHFVGLNDNPPETALGDDQKNWLDADLAKVDRGKTPWLFVLHHRPEYSCGQGHGSDVALRSKWQPLFDKYKVDMVFVGHDHLYERSKPIRGLMGTDGVIASSGAKGAPVSGSGTVYVVSGGAGAPLYDVQTTCPHTFVTEATPHYLVLKVGDKKLEYQAFRLDGTALDSFDYQK